MRSINLPFGCSFCVKELEIKKWYVRINAYEKNGGVEMALQDDLRAQLIKQFAAEVVELTEQNGKKFYACPTCKRPVVKSDVKCPGCQQALSWQNIRIEEQGAMGPRYATLRFEVPAEFSKGDCRKCPLSYIAKTNTENVYECPLNNRAHCPLDLD